MTGTNIPEMHAVTSSNVESVGHDGRHLFVRFKNGSTYRYLDCPDTHLHGMKADASPGRYHNHFIKNGGFLAEKVGG